MNTIASASIDRWQIRSAPAGWFFVPDFGLRHNAPDPASNIHLGGDLLLAGNKLEPYVEAQKSMLLRKYDQPVFGGPQPTRLLADQVEEGMMLLLKHQPMHGLSVLQVQTYVRRGTWIGIITLTTTERALQQVRGDYEQFVASLSISDAATGEASSGKQRS